MGTAGIVLTRSSLRKKSKRSRVRLKRPIMFNKCRRRGNGWSLAAEAEFSFTLLLGREVLHLEKFLSEHDFTVSDWKSVAKASSVG